MSNMVLGHKIRAIRTAKKITLQSLANITQLTPSFLSQMERGVVTPSIASLTKVAHALDMGVGEFFQEEMRGFTFVRKNNVLLTKNHETKTSCAVLVSNLLGIKMNPLIFKLHGGGEIKKELIDGEGDIFVMMLEGEATLHSHQETFLLTKGDSFYCKGQRKPQRITNNGEEETVLLWIQSM